MAKVIRYTGAVALDETLTFTESALLDKIEIHLGAASATVEDFTVNLDSIGGAAYDVNYYTIDMNGVQDLVWQPTRPYEILAGDKLDLDWANSNTETYGLTVYLR